MWQRFVWSFVLGGFVLEGQAAPLQVCLDKNANAPFVYTEKIKGAGKTIGYSFEVMQQIMAQAKLPYQIKQLSYADILAKIKSSQANAGCDIVLDVLKDSDIAKSLLLTPAIYSLRYDLMYNWERYMTGLELKKMADASKYKVCGLKHENYGAMAKTLNIHGYNTLKDVVFAVKTKECEVFVAESVTLRYGQSANQYQVPPVGCVSLVGTEKSYHIGLAQHVVGAEKVIQSLQGALLSLNKDVIKLAEKYDVNKTPCQQTLSIN